MNRLRVIASLLSLPLVSVFAHAEPSPSKIELLLPGGVFYSVSNRSYRALHLPQGWTVAAGAYAPTPGTVAFIVVGTTTSPPIKPGTHPVFGPLNKIVRPWRASTHLILLDRSNGHPLRTWAVPGTWRAKDWTLTWPNATTIRAVVSSGTLSTQFDFDSSQGQPPMIKRGLPDASASGVESTCPAVLAESTMDGKRIRFTREDADCSTPPEPNDVYSLVRENDPPHPESILWQYRVAVSTGACDEPYACYTGSAVHFLSSGGQYFLAWDADLYRLRDTPDGFQAALLTQWLPAYSHPWGISSSETMLDAMDVENKDTFQLASTGVSLSHGDHPQLVAQNFCLTRSFNATVTVGNFKKNVMVPAGYQVGPSPIISFDDSQSRAGAEASTGTAKTEDPDRVYTPLLVSLTWTSFHHISDPISCSSPFTLTPNTNGIIVSIRENENHSLHCDIAFQDAR